MREEKEQIILFAMLLGEVSANLVKKIEPNNNARYKILSQLKKRGLIRIYEDHLCGYRINWHQADSYIQKIRDKYAGLTDGIMQLKKRDCKSRMVIHNRNEIYRQLYQSEILYLPGEKPKIGSRFPYTGNPEYLNKVKIHQKAKEAPMFYCISEIKRIKKGAGFKVESDDVLARNRSAGILISAEELFNIYSFMAYTLNLKWHEKADEPIYILLSALAENAKISTIYIGKNLDIAEQFLEKGEMTGKSNYGVSIDNCGKGNLYFIPASTQYKNNYVSEVSETRMIRYLVNNSFRKEMDETILRYLGADRVNSSIILGRTADGKFIFNLMDFDLKKLRCAVNVAKAVIFCFEWQESFFRQQFEKRDREVTVYAYKEADILKLMDQSGDKEK